jgi:predicted aspartyl protease
MKSIADQLPPEIAKQIHPEWRKNEADYWAVREELLAKYKDQWIGFADGRVVASGRIPVEVLDASEAAAEHSFFTCVGHEDQPIRMRRASFGYDTNYPGEPLPKLAVEFRSTRGSVGIVLDQLIADTGADATALPWLDCQQLGLSLSKGRPSTMTGVAGGSAPTLTFRIWVQLDGQEHVCQLQADFVGNERILGRDVLNRFDILFRGPACEVVVSP